ncbi:hypothetical protein PHYPO_G00115600 [Pangasianodon hypophthalmus]|uniref:BHLH domain-containing protein n=1 Tax=Pangasianodon hypophthalmus TaxID=310915 RepID=A0A5N5L348_PANHP|nr:hypothetical protein PHYPO_G00115600 [Pangasianodon hypophthalmus]
MAPTITSAMTISNEHLPLNNKLRKLMVEKMLEIIINSSIEQLKSLLAPEFLHQEPDSKLEKADILEMTVVHFLSKEEVKTQSQRKLLNHFQNLQPSSDENRRESVLPQLSSTEQQIISKEKSSVKSALWRPW